MQFSLFLLSLREHLPINVKARGEAWIQEVNINLMDLYLNPCANWLVSSQAYLHSPGFFTSSAETLVYQSWPAWEVLGWFCAESSSPEWKWISLHVCPGSSLSTCPCSTCLDRSLSHLSEFFTPVSRWIQNPVYCHNYLLPELLQSYITRNLLLSFAPRGRTKERFF